MTQKANVVPEGFCLIFNQCITIIYLAIYRILIDWETDDKYFRYNILRFYHVGIFSCSLLSVFLKFIKTR